MESGIFMVKEDIMVWVVFIGTLSYMKYYIATTGMQTFYLV